MADRSGIEWTGATWNPTTGCDRVSPGCDNCYALTLARRLKAMGQPHYQVDGHPATSGPGFGVTAHPEALRLPYRWRRPRLVFVNSMSDLFHARVPAEFVAEVFAVMADLPRHTFQVLTKRPLRAVRLAPSLTWPGNVWLGVSVETNAQAHRVDMLRRVPAALRFISAEPLLGPLELDLAGIGWVIAGGESGPRARPAHPDWVRNLRDRCVVAGVPFFFKQWGAWAPGGHPARPHVAVDLHGGIHHRLYTAPPGSADMSRWDAKADAGRLLDGRTWDQLPTRWPAPPDAIAAEPQPSPGRPADGGGVAYP